MASNSEQHHSNRKFEVNSDVPGASEISSSAASVQPQPVSMASKRPEAIAGTSANAVANSASYHHGRQTSLPASMNIQQPQQPPIPQPQPLYGNQANHVHFQNDLILRHQRVPNQQLSDHHQNISKILIIY